MSRLPFQIYFPHSKVQHSAVVPFVLCAMVGILAAIMGVGGGFMMVPMMVYLLRMPPHVAVGTDLFQILFTCAGVTYMQATTNYTVDLVLALLLAAGSTVGAQIGARATRFLRGEQLLIILASLALIVVVKMVISVVTTPTSLLEPAAHAGLRSDRGAVVALLQKADEDRVELALNPRHASVIGNQNSKDRSVEPNSGSWVMAPYLLLADGFGKASPANAAGAW